MSKKVLLLSIMISVFLISLVSAFGDGCGFSWESGCDEEDYSENYCFGGDVYTEFHDFFYEGSCWNKECKKEVTIELFEDCGEEEYGEWDNYCEGNDVHKQRYRSIPGCANAACYIGTVIQDDLIQECDYDCIDGECIVEPPVDPICGNDILEGGEQCDDGNLIDGDGCSSICEIEPIPPEPVCYVNSDCGIDHCIGGANYCIENDVYQDFIVYTCNNPGQVDAYCSNNEEHWLLEECDYMCVEGECIDEPEPPVNICGDDNLNIGVEECDDGNTENGDGCSSICEIEDPEPPEPCDDDYYEDKYCYGEDVYRDFHSFNSIDDMCVEDILEELFDKCDGDETCEDGKCVEDDDDDDNDNTCNDRELYNNCRLSEVEDVLVVYEPLKDEVKVINKDISLINKSQEKITDNSWILYLFLGVCGLIVLILIVLGVKK